VKVGGLNIGGFCSGVFTTPCALTYYYVNARVVSNRHGKNNACKKDKVHNATQQNGYNSRYTFSAKEKDDETQYSYFGARYYDSDVSIWLSVDPMAGKYPSLSPYAYCANNPIVFFDPNGLDTILFNQKGDFKQQYRVEMRILTPM